MIVAQELLKKRTDRINNEFTGPQNIGEKDWASIPSYNQHDAVSYTDTNTDIRSFD